MRDPGYSIAVDLVQILYSSRGGLKTQAVLTKVEGRRREEGSESMTGWIVETEDYEISTT